MTYLTPSRRYRISVSESIFFSWDGVALNSFFSQYQFGIFIFISLNFFVYDFLFSYLRNIIFGFSQPLTTKENFWKKIVFLSWFERIYFQLIKKVRIFKYISHLMNIIIKHICKITHNYFCCIFGIFLQLSVNMNFNHLVILELSDVNLYPSFQTILAFSINISHILC